MEDLQLYCGLEWQKVNLTHSAFAVISSRHTGQSLRVPSSLAGGPRTGSSRMGVLARARCPVRSRLCEVLIWARALFRQQRDASPPLRWSRIEAQDTDS